MPVIELPTVGFVPSPPLLLPGIEDASELLASIEVSTQRRLEHILAVEAGGPEAIELELAICAEDSEYWLQWYVWTYDPRNPLETPALPSNLPFDLCPKQLELWRWIEDILLMRQDGCVKKSRGIGFTWIVGAKAWHKWRWSKGFKTTFASRKSTEVDQIGNPDSIFEKMRLLYRGLPKWMLPIGFNPNVHDKQMLLINPENDNTIRGEGGDEIGRGGRSTMIVVDEAAVLEHADRVEAATSANADVRIWGSTINPRNENNLFQRKYSSFPPERVFRFHYSEHPIWTAERIRKKKLDLSPEVWAAEFEIDDSYTVEDITIPQAWVKASVKIRAKLDERVVQLRAQGEPEENLTRFKMQPSVEGVAGGDVGGGKAESVVVGRFGPVVTKPKAWKNPDTTDTALKMLDYCAEKLRLPIREDQYEPKIRALRYDSVAIGQGVAATMRRNPRPGLIVVGINTGNPASNVKWPDGKYAHEKFRNMKAEGWWTLRERFKRTIEMYLWLDNPEQDGALFHPADELISLPDDPSDQLLERLISQLSWPKWFRTDSGKIQMESKESMLRLRQLPSPDYADALVLTCCGQGKAEKWVAFSKVQIV